MTNKHEDKLSNKLSAEDIAVMSVQLKELIEQFAAEKVKEAVLMMSNTEGMEIVRAEAFEEAIEVAKENECGEYCCQDEKFKVSTKLLALKDRKI